MYILGISAYYHDSSATLLKDGKIIAALDEERLTRKKHDSGFPINAIFECLKIGGISIKDIDYIAYYEKPILKLERVMSQYVEFFPKNFRAFTSSMQDWINKKLRVQKEIRKKLKYKKDIFYINHHLSHAASSFFTSDFKESAIAVIDGVGEWATTSIGVGEGSKIKIKKQINFPHSIGLLYSTITAYLGFRVNNSEYKVMGLSAYGDFNKKTNKYYSKLKKVVIIKPDGSFFLKLKYFDYTHKKRMPSKKLCSLLGGKIRDKREELSNRHKDIAAALQMLTEKMVLNVINEAYRVTRSENLVMAGGVALNSVINSKIVKKTEFKNIWIQPSASDSGGSMGAALYVHNSILKNKRTFGLENIYLGSSYSDRRTKKALKESGLNFKYFSDYDLIKKIAGHLYDNKVIGWFRGGMEWGPRALGNRSILANPTDKNARDNLNEKVKFREKFRPFAPVLCYDDIEMFFENFEGNEKLIEYMLGVLKFKKEWRDKIPSVVHVNGTGRPQAIKREKNKLYYDLIKEFGKISGASILINTSFNVRGEPIVRTPEEAIACFLKSGIDCLVLNNYLILKEK